MTVVTIIIIVAVVLALLVIVSSRINHKTNVIFSEFLEKNIVEVLESRVSMPAEEIHKHVKTLLEGGQVQGLNQLRKVLLLVESVGPKDCRTVLDIFVELEGVIHKITVENKLNRDSLPTEIAYELLRNEGKAEFELVKAR